MMDLDGEAARATLEALTRYYQGAPDLREVRKDLIHERGRVDKMLDALITSNAVQLRPRDGS